MHSKVIITSLACVLAASFASGRTTNVSMKAQQPETSGINCCNAPNEERLRLNIAQPVVERGSYFAVSLGVYGDDPLYQEIEITEDENNLCDESSFFFYQNGGYAVYIYAPTYSGNAHVTFGAHGKELATVYIYTDEYYSAASSLSLNDAQARLFLETNATSTELQYYPCGANEPITSNVGFNAVRRYGTYAYGTNDIATNRTTTTGSGFNSNLTVKIHADYYINGVAYPAEGLKLSLFLDGAQIRKTTTKRTSTSGNYSITLNYNDGYFFKKLGSLQFALYADSYATVVEDSNRFNYPYLYGSSSSTNLYSLKTVTFNVKIYPDRSDRGAAYEITQVQSMIRNHINEYNSTNLPSIKTEYPCHQTSYGNSLYYDETVIRVRKEHYHSWDVIAHEYAHYACDKLNLCEVILGEKHKYNENLANIDGFDYGARLAYSEGLATYIALSGIFDRGTRYGGYAATIDDLVYDDSPNNLHVDYKQIEYARGTCVEASTTRIMVDLLIYSPLDIAGIWSLINSASSRSSLNIIEFVKEFIEIYKDDAAEIMPFLENENITSQYDGLKGQNKRAKWTIMLYMSPAGEGSRNLSTSLSESFEGILGIPKPDDVNVVFLIDKTPMAPEESSIPIRVDVGYCGYIDGTSFKTVEGTYKDYKMGEPDTLKKFLRWGITEYPAEKMGLVFFNHGGALNGVCFDEDGDSLTALEVASVMEDIYTEFPYLHGKFEFVGYDACLMQVQDVAYYNSKYFNYMIASEEFNYGWDYSNFIQRIYDGSNTLSAFTTLCDDFIVKNNKHYIAHNEGEIACISVLNLSKMETYYHRFEYLAHSINGSVADNYVEFANIINQSKKYGNRTGDVIAENFTWYGTIDGYDFLTKLSASPSFAQYSSQINSVKAAYSSVITINRKTDPANKSYGLAIHVCLNGTNQTYDINQTNFYNWRSLFC